MGLDQGGVFLVVREMSSTLDEIHEVYASDIDKTVRIVYGRKGITPFVDDFINHGGKRQFILHTRIKNFGEKARKEGL